MRFSSGAGTTLHQNAGINLAALYYSEYGTSRLFAILTDDADFSFFSFISAHIVSTSGTAD